MKKKTVVAALLGLAMTGCANTRKAGPTGGPAEGPVGMRPIPSLHETINRGYANPAVSRRTLPDPSSLNWSARTPLRDVHAPAAAPVVASSGGAIPAAAAAPAAPPIEPPAQLPALAAQGGLSDPAAPLGDPAVSPSSLAPTPAAAVPGESVEMAPLPPIAESLDAPGAAPEAAPAPAPEPSAEPVAPALNEPTPLPAPVPEPEAPVAAPTVPVAPPSDGGDPLLGPNPELMPSSLGDPVAPEVPAPGPAEAPAPAPEPVPTPTPAPAPAPVETSSLPEFSPSPASGGGAEPAPMPTADPEPDAAPDAGPTTGPTSQAAARVDAEVRQASAMEIAADVIDPNWKKAGETAARVGDEVITMRELVVGVRDQVKRHGMKMSDVPRDELNMLGQNILANLIDRSLIYQEAKHELKDKKLDDLLKIAEEVWKEQELPPLLRLNQVPDEHQLRRKMEETGRSLAALKLSHRQDFIAMLYIQQKLKDKVQVELPEMLKYYNVHMNDQTNHRPARITWREVVVEASQHPSPAEARRKAEGLLARLKQGEDFAKLAKAETDGPSKVKADGGLMETSPGGYGVAAVNRALETLPLNTISGVIEGPSSFHIVRVENRRPAGPAGFAELQDQIRGELLTQKSNRERRLLLTRLREHTIVTTIFDGTASDPKAVQR